MPNCKNYWENLDNSGKSFNNVILIQFLLCLLKDETFSYLCYTYDGNYFRSLFHKNSSHAATHDRFLSWTKYTLNEI